jgi:hypothetical protein
MPATALAAVASSQVKASREHHQAILKIEILAFDELGAPARGGVLL